MNIITIGSKICDDALVNIKSEIHNTKRLVDISPFSILEDSFELNLQESEIRSDNIYKMKMFIYDINKQCIKDLEDKDKYDYVVIDLLDTRIPFKEFVLKNGKKLRVTANKILDENYTLLCDKIKEKYKCDIEYVNDNNPLLWKKDELEYELENFIKKIKVLKDKIILLISHNTYQYFNKDGKFSVLKDKIKQVNQYNEFYDLCYNYFKSKVKCLTIDIPGLLFGEEKDRPINIFTFNNFYYQYIVDSIINFNNKKDNINSIKKYQSSIKMFIDKIVSKSLVDLTPTKCKGKKIVLIGECMMYETGIFERWGLTVSKKIDYTQTSSNDYIMEQIKELKDKSDEYICVVPYIYRNSNILEILWKMGYGYGRGYFCTVHDQVVLENFYGLYEDIFNNRVEVKAKSKIQITLLGIANNILIEDSYNNCCVDIRATNNTKIVLSRGLKTGNIPLTMMCYDGSVVQIGSDTSFVNACHIRATYFSKVSIGQDCMFSTEVIVFAGDGHAIFDVNTGENINYNYKNISEAKREIYIGDHVWAGFQSFILTGSHIGTGCVIGARAFVNKKFPNNCALAGTPAKIIRQNIAWDRDLFTDNVDIINSSYTRLTEI